MGKTATNVFGAVVGLAIVAVIAAKPQFLATTFSGGSSLIKAAVSPVTGK